MTYRPDALERNEMHAAMREESRDALDDMTETERRSTPCRGVHRFSRRDECCVDCGEGPC